MEWLLDSFGAGFGVFDFSGSVFVSAVFAGVFRGGFVMMFFLSVARALPGLFAVVLVLVHTL